MAIDKARILKHLETEVYCRLGVSPIHGIGVFAIRDIPKGTQPLVSLLKIKEFSFSKKVIKKLPSSVQKEVRMFCYYNKDEYLIPSIGLNAMNMAFYMNHSKNPNIKYLKNNTLLSLRKIKAGEELFFDYDLAFDEEHNFE